MIKNALKTTPIFIFVFCLTFKAHAQLGYNYAQVDLGVATGLNQVYGSAASQTTTQSIQFNFTYNSTPYTNFVFEAQFGKLAGGDSLTSKYGRQFNNNFSAFLLREQVQAGELIDYSRSPLYNALKNFYLSTGIGLIVNHITSINRYSILIPGYYTPGENNSMEPFVPIRLGYEFKIFNRYNQPNIKIDLGLQYNLVLGSDVDGYNIANHEAYFQSTVGVKFAVGSGNTSYRKPIQY